MEDHLACGPDEPEGDHARKNHFEGGFNYHSQHRQHPCSPLLPAPDSQRALQIVTEALTSMAEIGWLCECRS